MIRASETPPPTPFPFFAAALLAALTLPGCGGDDSGRVSHAQGGWKPPGPDAPVLSYEFGMLRHGAKVRHTFDIPMPDDEHDYVPLGYSRNCTCATHEFVIVGGDGAERIPTGQPLPQFAVRDGENLQIRLTIDTSLKEPTYQKSVVVPGQIVLQTSKAPYEQKRLPVQFSFGIQPPIEVTPAATVAFNQMPRSTTFSRDYYLSSKEGPVRYGAVRIIERDPADPSRDREVPDITHTLEQDGTKAKLRLTFAPSDERSIGPFACRILIETDLPLSEGAEETGAVGPGTGGYTLELPATATVVPDIQLGPPGRFSFGQIDFAAPNQAQCTITDHDRTREPEFYIVRIVDTDDRDVSEHFTGSVEIVPERPRSRMLLLDYHGTLDGNIFRGRAHLAKSAQGPVVQTVDIVAFRRR